MFGSFLRALWSVFASRVYSGLQAHIVHGIIPLVLSGARFYAEFAAL
jgi:hypothetical protein